ncbi:signal recognition particle protein [bacterium]|nr:signal recognition particle protein [bacterium]
MFDTLTERLQKAFKRLSGHGKLGQKDIREGLKEIRLALLEADVHYQVVKDFQREIQNAALGEDILKGLNPAQQIVKIVHGHLVHLLGDAAVPVKRADKPPTVILLCGLQGAGKTTTAGKLAASYKREGARPLLCATDIYRPAAIEQLKQVGGQVGVEVFSMGESNPVSIARAAHSYAVERAMDPMIIDTAGRLQIDEAMMQEAADIEASFPEVETLLVVDSMTGQDAVNVANGFNTKLHLDGLILTKLDSDARGGAALSLRSVTGVPIKFVTVSERMDGLEVFHPDRMAQRILGMGDVLTLIERAQSAVDAEEAAKLQQKLLKAEFDLEDFRQHLKRVRSMGPLDQLMKMIPGAAQMGAAMPDDLDERELDMVDAIISSMTKDERAYPDVLNASRKRRIARGSGTTVQDVNILLKEYRQLSQMMGAMAKGKGFQIGGLRFGPMR